MATLAEARLGKWLEEFEAKHVARGVRKGIAQSMELGVAQGMERGMERVMTVLKRQAELKFGSAAAARIGDALNGNLNEKRMERVGLWLVECASADDFLARMSELEG